MVIGIMSTFEYFFMAPLSFCHKISKCKHYISVFIYPLAVQDEHGCTSPPSIEYWSNTLCWRCVAARHTPWPCGLPMVSRKWTNFALRVSTGRVSSRRVLGPWNVAVGGSSRLPQPLDSRPPCTCTKCGRNTSDRNWSRMNGCKSDSY